MDDMQGVRIEDNTYPENPGEYSKSLLQDGTVFWFMTVPTGGRAFFIGKPNSDGSPHHHVEENPDGTITVRPNPPADPDNSNSILYNSWHGYIYNGVWKGNVEE